MQFALCIDSLTLFALSGTVRSGDREEWVLTPNIACMYMNHVQSQQSGSAQNPVQGQVGQRGRGLAAADPETRTRVASAGGQKVSQDRKHMSEIGRLGGQHSHTKSRQEDT